MLTDAFLKLSSAQDLSGVAGAATVSENVVDLSVNRDLGPGRDLYVALTIDETFDDTLQVDLIIADDAAMSTNKRVVVSTGTMQAADLTAGRGPINLPIAPANDPDAPIGARYLALEYTAGGAQTGGQITAHIVGEEVTTQAYYPSGYQVY